MNFYNEESKIEEFVTNTTYTLIPHLERYYNKDTIPKIIECDTIKFNQLLISNKIRLNEIHELCVNIGNYTIWKIPFCILLQLSKIMLLDDVYQISINEKLFGITDNTLLLDYDIKDSGIVFIAMQYSGLSIKLISKNNFDYKMTFITRKYETSLRISLAQRSHSYTISQICKFEKEITSQICRFEIASQIMIDGIIIVSRDHDLDSMIVSNNNFLLKILDQDQIDYNIKGVAHKIKINEFCWSKEHYLTVHDILKDIFPIEIIHKICELCFDNNYMGNLYWTPFMGFHDWDRSERIEHNGIYYNNKKLNYINNKIYVNDNIFGIERETYIKRPNILQYLSGGVMLLTDYYLLYH
jgi:hypothetical protein